VVGAGVVLSIVVVGWFVVVAGGVDVNPMNNMPRISIRAITLSTAPHPLASYRVG
jgi:hypothetical protein